MTLIIRGGSLAVDVISAAASELHHDSNHIIW